MSSQTQVSSQSCRACSSRLARANCVRYLRFLGPATKASPGMGISEHLF